MTVVDYNCEYRRDLIGQRGGGGGGGGGDDVDGVVEGKGKRMVKRNENEEGEGEE